MRYPYLSWASAHFHEAPAPESLDADTFPLTREIEASEANYARSSIVGAPFAAERWSTPHTWHGAEIFLYHLDVPSVRAGSRR